MRRAKRLAVVFAVLSTTVLIGAAPAGAGQGATQVSGSTDFVACPGGPGDWATPDYAFHISGDLDGCVYGLVSDARCHPSGVYQEVADEIFVDDDSGDTFEMTEFFWAKYEFDVPCDFDTITAQVFGGCKHPIVTGTGTGEYDGVTGRLDFKDDVDTGLADYKGHLRGIELS